MTMCANPFADLCALGLFGLVDACFFFCGDLRLARFAPALASLINGISVVLALLDAAQLEMVQGPTGATNHSH